MYILVVRTILYGSLRIQSKHIYQYYKYINVKLSIKLLYSTHIILILFLNTQMLRTNGRNLISLFFLCNSSEMTILKAPPHSFNRNTCVLGGILFPLNTGLIKKTTSFILPVCHFCIFWPTIYFG